MADRHQSGLRFGSQTLEKASNRLQNKKIPVSFMAGKKCSFEESLQHLHPELFVLFVMETKFVLS